MDRNSTLKSSLGHFLRSLWDLMMVNILWTACSLPIVTIGPATCAAYNVLLKTARDESTATFSEFFKAFRSNFKQALLLGLIALAGIVVVSVDIQFAMTFEGKVKTLYLVLSGILGGLLLIFAAYVFPLQARFENSLKGHVINAFKLAFVAPGKTIFMWILWLIIPATAVLLPRDVVLTFGWFYLLFAVSLPMYINSRILRNLFDKLMGEKTNDES